MSTIVTRAGKGTPLTNNEVDANFTNLNTDKLETSAIGTLVPSMTGYNKSNWDTAYGWGNHALAGYLTSESDTLTSVTNRGASTTNSLTIGGLTINSTGAAKLPVGTEAQRPTPVTGMLRFNTTTAAFEGYNGSFWGAIGGGGSTDGGFANSVYLANQIIDGGSANG